MQLLVWNDELFQGARGLSFPFSLRAGNVFPISNIFKLGEKKITKALGAVVFFSSLSVLFMNGRTIFIFLISSDRTSGSPCILLWNRKNVRQEDYQPFLIPTEVTPEPHDYFKQRDTSNTQEVIYMGVCFLRKKKNNYSYILPSNFYSSSFTHHQLKGLHTFWNPVGQLRFLSLSLSHSLSLLPSLPLSFSPFFP